MLTRRNFLGAVGALTLVVATILFGGDIRAQEPGTVGGLVGVSSSPVHPVLIRNEHGPLTRVVVVAEPRCPRSRRS